MRSLVMRCWGVLHSPRKTLQAIAESPCFGTATVLLLVFGLIVGLAELYPRWTPGAHYDAGTWRDGSPGMLMLLASFVGVTLTFWTTLLTWSLVRLLRERRRFETLFCVMTFAELPMLFAVVLYPLGARSYVAHSLWRLLHFAMLIWATVLTCIGLRVGCHFAAWKAGLVALPALVLLWGMGVGATIATSPSFVAAYPWQCSEGQSVVVYTPVNVSPQQTADLTRRCDAMLARICRALDVAPLTIKPAIFLCTDDKMLGCLVGEERSTDEGYAFHTCVIMTFGSWQKLSNTVAHELCHVVVEQRLADNVSGLIDEGLAVYIAQKIAPDPNEPEPAVMTLTSLRALARPDLFYDWDEAEESGGSAYAHYTQAYALVRYLIQCYGLEKYKRFYLAVAQNGESSNDGERLANAANDVYGLSLTELEQQFRDAHGSNGSSASEPIHPGQRIPTQWIPIRPPRAMKAHSFLSSQ